MTTRLSLAMTVLFGWLAAGAHATDALTNLLGDHSMATSTSPTQMVSWGGEVEEDKSYSDEVAFCAPRLLQLSIGQRTWFTEGETTENIAPVVGSPNPMSELTWKNMDSTVVELNVDAVLREKIVLSADVGFGGIDDGRFLDQDFLADDRQYTFSSTWADAIGDDLAYFNLDLGYRVLSSQDECGKLQRFLDLFVGWQYWRESYMSSTGSGVRVDPGTINFDTGEGPGWVGDVAALGQSYEWNSLRLGVRGQLDISRRFALRGQLAFVPYTSLDFHDTHFDWQGTPWKEWDANVDGGWGVMLDETLSYNVWRGLFVEVGYQVYYLNSGSGVGDFQPRSAGGAPGQFTFNEAETIRHGVLLDVRYDF